MGYVAALTVAAQAAPLRPAEIAALLVENADLKRQVEGCKRHLFGRKSARRLGEPEPHHRSLRGLLPTPIPAADQPPPPTETVKASQRRVQFTGSELSEDRELRCDSTVPIQESLLPNPTGAALSPDAYEVMGEKVP